MVPDRAPLVCHGGRPQRESGDGVNAAIRRSDGGCGLRLPAAGLAKPDEEMLAPLLSLEEWN